MKRKQSALSDFWPKKDTSEAPPAREAATPRVTTGKKPQQLSRRLDLWFGPPQDDLSSLLPPTAKRVATEQEPQQSSNRLSFSSGPIQNDLPSLLPPIAERAAINQLPSLPSSTVSERVATDQADSLPSTASEHLATNQTPDGVVTNQASPGSQPFSAKDIYICPYVAIQKCNSAEKFFNTYRSLCGHVSSHHQEDCLPSTYDEDPLENGTSKIPCPRGCGETFTSHQQANHHAKKPAS